MLDVASVVVVVVVEGRRNLSLISQLGVEANERKAVHTPFVARSGGVAMSRLPGGGAAHRS